MTDDELKAARVLVNMASPGPWKLEAPDRGIRGPECPVVFARCPLPCDKCRANRIGAFCGTTPCPCRCHGDRRES